MDQVRNEAMLRGLLAQGPEYSHENHGRKFFRLYIQVERLSGAVDVLPVVAEEGLCPPELEIGEMVKVTGQVRSHNIRSDGRRHLLIFLFASEICREEGEHLNQVFLSGPVCRPPIHRRTPLGREICDVMLAVPRAFRRADYLPCILWGQMAREAAQCQVRDIICLEGRLQSRAYTKLTDTGPEQRTAYEISALSAEVWPDTSI